MNITGKVVYVNVSGGTWGIEGDDGEKYLPVEGLPAHFQKEGIRIKATVHPSPSFTIFMWGKNVMVKNITREG